MKNQNKKVKSKIFHYSSLKENRKAAIEMSVGTIVTIVLSMTLLIGLLFFIRSIVSSGTNAIDSIDASIQKQINQLFTEGEGNKKIIIYPVSREIKFKKGMTNAGFGISIMNTGSENAIFSYEVKAIETDQNCMTIVDADKLLGLGSARSDIELGSRESIDPYDIVRFSIPDDAPFCKIRYSVDVKKNSAPYVTTTLDAIIG